MLCALTLAAHPASVSLPQGVVVAAPPPHPLVAVEKMAKGLVFSNWAFLFIASLGIAITYNMCALLCGLCLSMVASQRVPWVLMGAAGG